MDNSNTENKTRRSFLYKRNKSYDKANNKSNDTQPGNVQADNGVDELSQKSIPAHDGKIFDFQEMKKMPLAELVVLGLQEMEIENADTMLKQNLMFMILKQAAINGNKIVGGSIGYIK